jgi:hypothetical protein
MDIHGDCSRIRTGPARIVTSDFKFRPNDDAETFQQNCFFEHSKFPPAAHWAVSDGSLELRELLRDPSDKARRLTRIDRFILVYLREITLSPFWSSVCLDFGLLHCVKAHAATRSRCFEWRLRFKKKKRRFFVNAVYGVLDSISFEVVV